MSYPKIDFLYLNEEDMIQAGVLDAAKCIDKRPRCQAASAARNGNRRRKRASPNNKKTRNTDLQTDEPDAIV